MKRGGMYKPQKGEIITRTKYKESRYLLESKPADYQIKFDISRRIMMRKRIINREVASIKVIKKSLLGILESSDILLAGILLPRNITKG